MLVANWTFSKKQKFVSLVKLLNLTYKYSLTCYFTENPPFSYAVRLIVIYCLQSPSAGTSSFYFRHKWKTHLLHFNELCYSYHWINFIDGMSVGRGRTVTQNSSVCPDKIYLFSIFLYFFFSNFTNTVSVLEGYSVTCFMYKVLYW